MPKPYGNEWIQSSPSAEQTPKQRIHEFTKGEKELALLGGGRLSLLRGACSRAVNTTNDTYFTTTCVLLQLTVCTVAWQLGRVDLSCVSDVAMRSTPPTHAPAHPQPSLLPEPPLDRKPVVGMT